MKKEQLATLMNCLPFDCRTMIVHKDPAVHGVGFHEIMHEFAKKNGVELVSIDMSFQDEFFLHELRELIEFRKGKNFICLFDFTGGCGKPDSELKEHLLQLLIHRKHNGFEIPWTVKVVIYDNIVDENEYITSKFDMCMLDKCLIYKLED